MADARELARLLADAKAENDNLRGIEDRFRAVFENMIEACCIFEMIYDDWGKPIDWMILEANAGYETQSGLKGVTGKLASEFMPGTEGHWFETFHRVLETGEPEQIEKWHQPTGRWVHSSTARVGGSGSRRLISVFYDITERKRAEIALRESEARQSFLLQLSDELRPLGDPAAIQSTASRLLVDHLGAHRAMYLEIEGTGAGSISVIRGQYAKNVPLFPERVAYEEFAKGFPKELLTARETLVVTDIPATSASVKASVMPG